MEESQKTEENRKAFRLLGVESVIIIILIIVIVLILSYLNILPLGNLFKLNTNSKISPTPTVQKGFLDPSREALKLHPDAPAKVIASSSNPSYTLTVNNEKEFIESVLKDFPLFGRSFTGKPDSVINTLSVILVDKPGNTSKLIDDQGVYSSTDVKLSNSTMVVEQYFAPRVFEKYGEGISQLLQGVVIFNVYNYVYGMYAPELVNKPNGPVQKINNSLREMGKTYFIIKRAS